MSDVKRRGWPSPPPPSPPPPSPPPPSPPPPKPDVSTMSALLLGTSSFFSLRSLIAALLLSLGIRLLTLNSSLYRSTDFEVHRNWLGVCGSLPFSSWYSSPLSELSEWTLDYPPLFGLYQWALSKAMALVDKDMVALDGGRYGLSERKEAYPLHVVEAMRLSVILSDGVLYMAAFAIPTAMVGFSGVKGQGRVRDAWVWWAGAIVTVLSPGLFLVDHIHFQYNGMLLGVLLLGVLLLMEGRPIATVLVVGILLYMKHLFLYAIPPLGVFLLSNYCIGKPDGAKMFALFAAVAAGVSALVMGPFIAEGQLTFMARRLFPFGRGLMHSYWAANAWALYASLDKLLLSVLSTGGGTGGYLAGGLVGAKTGGFLPTITPSIALVIVVVSMVPCLRWIYSCRGNGDTSVPIKAVSHCFLCSFMFGWHVHEKAILPVVLPMGMIAGLTRSNTRDFLILSTAGQYGLLPLLFRQDEYVVKICAFGSFVYLIMGVYGRRGHKGDGDDANVLSPVERIYIAGFLPLELLCSWALPHLLGQRLPFLPLMLTSLYCSLGISYVWMTQLISMLKLATSG